MLRNTKGFTLIELMIVVVIIGILAAIAIPNFISMQDRAKESSVKANMHTLQLAIEDFAVTNDGTYPLAADNAAVVLNLPISISGLGVRVGGLIILLDPFRLTDAAAVALSFLLLGRSLLLGVLGALLELRAGDHEPVDDPRVVGLHDALVLGQRGLHVELRGGVQPGVVDRLLQEPPQRFGPGCLLSRRGGW